MHPLLQNYIQQLIHDRQSGSRQLLQTALVPLIQRSFSANDLQHYAYHLRWIRPAMAALRNLSDRIAALVRHNPTPVVFQQLAQHFDKASIRTAEIAINRLPSPARIATISYSSLVEAVLVQGIRDKNKQWEIFCFESQVGAYQYGQIFYERLQHQHISATIIADRTAEPPLLDLILIGADSFSPLYGLVNGQPTYSICKQLFHRIPIYCCAESFKHTHTLLVEPGFDFLPSSFHPIYLSDYQ